MEGGQEEALAYRGKYGQVCVVAVLLTVEVWAAWERLALKHTQVYRRRKTRSAEYKYTRNKERFSCFSSEWYVTWTADMSNARMEVVGI